MKKFQSIPPSGSSRLECMCSLWSSGVFTLSVGAEQKDVLKKYYMVYPIEAGHCIGKEEQLYLKLPVEVPDPNPISNTDPSYSMHSFSP